MKDHHASAASSDNMRAAAASSLAPTGIGDERAIEVRRHHHVELLWLGDELHHAVVDDHLLVLDRGVQLQVGRQV